LLLINSIGLVGKSFLYKGKKRSKMTLQWTLIAVFLYVEIAFLLLLMLPWIRPPVWQKLFKSRLVKALETYSSIYFYSFGGILVLLFFDAIREVKKYGTTDLSLEDKFATPNADTMIHMRLFRAQRNLYIAGFALFLYLVCRRMVQMISREAQLMASAEAAMKTSPRSIHRRTISDERRESER